jgi:hypothetical protein
MANIFPRWANGVPLRLLFCAGTLAVFALGWLWYYYGPRYTRVGYEPTQPVPFDHSLHANQLGVDCRYCHTYVDVSGHSNLPTTQTCMNCHAQVKSTSPALEAVRRSWTTGEPVRWVWVHRLPDYVYFNHAAHVNRGVSCVSCHGPVQQMRVIYHHQPLNMGWCLDCHRHPEQKIRPLEQVYHLDWVPPVRAEAVAEGKRLVERSAIVPPQDCAGCHR